jgi:hypothetical protein
MTGPEVSVRPGRTIDLGYLLKQLGRRRPVRWFLRQATADQAAQRDRDERQVGGLVDHPVQERLRGTVAKGPVSGGGVTEHCPQAEHVGCRAYLPAHSLLG